MSKKLLKHLYTLTDQLIDKNLSSLKNKKKSISCKCYCSHCCYLLVEATWHEAIMLAEWILSQPKKKCDFFHDRVKANAKIAKKFLGTYKSGKKFIKPLVGDYEIPDRIADKYFYDLKEPCPFLKNNKCTAYKYRPISCRMHLVTTKPEYCSDLDQFKNNEVKIPIELEELKNKIGDVAVELYSDARWGQLGIIVSAALDELISKRKN